MAQNGLTEDSTGDLICCGYAVFTPGAGQTYRTNVPVPGFRRLQRNIPNMHRWNGATYIEVPQPAITTCHTSCAGDTMRAVIDSDEDSDQSAGNEHKWEVWDGHPDNGGVVAFKVSLVNNVLTLSTPASGGLAFGDVQIASLGVGVAPTGVSGDGKFAAGLSTGGRTPVADILNTSAIRFANATALSYSGTTLRIGAATFYTAMQLRTGNVTRVSIDSAGLVTVVAGVECNSLGVGTGPTGNSGDGKFSDGSRTMHYDAAAHFLKLSGGAALVGTTDAEALGLVTGNANRWNVNASGHFRAALDDTYDYGGSGIERPRTGYFGRSLNVGDGVTVTVVNGSINAGDGTRAFKWDAAAGTCEFIGTDTLKVWTNTPTGATTSTDGGYMLSHANIPAGLFTEVNGELLSLAINTPQAGVRDNARVGGIFRLDSRSSSPHFSIRGFPTGGAVANARLLVNLQTGNIVVNEAQNAPTPLQVKTNSYANGLEVRSGGQVLIASHLNGGTTTDASAQGQIAWGIAGGNRWVYKSTGHTLTFMSAGDFLLKITSFSAGSWSAGMLTEVSGEIFSYAINTSHVGTRTTTRVGAIFRLDTRPAEQLFVVRRFPTGGSTAYDLCRGNLQTGEWTHNYDQQSGGHFTVRSAGLTTAFKVDAGTDATTIGGDLNHDGAKSGFNAAAPVAKQTVTGSRGGNAALASLLTAMATVGLITDSTT